MSRIKREELIKLNLSRVVNLEREINQNFNISLNISGLYENDFNRSSRCWVNARNAFGEEAMGFCYSSLAENCLINKPLLNVPIQSEWEVINSAIRFSSEPSIEALIASNKLCNRKYFSTVIKRIK